MKILNRYIILFIVAVVTIVSSNIQWGEKNSHAIIQSDGKGYYSYLPAVFIYHDLHFGFFEEIEKRDYKPNTYYDYRASYNNNIIDKYYSGVAVAMLPFFLLAHLITHLKGLSADGYTSFYQIFANVAAIFYLFVGLTFLRRFLKRQAATNSQITFLLIAFTFGTNLFYYTINEPSMSHIYSFAFVAMFILYLKLFFDEVKIKYLMLSALALGMIILIRPVNVMIVGIIPFLTGSLVKLKESFIMLIKKPAWMVGAFLIMFSICSIQLIIYKLQTGTFLFDSYSQEKFKWNDPHFADILFSYKKGLFIYTPLTFLSLIGFIKLWQKSKFQFLSLLLFLTLITYILSSWWCWYYGGSFGLRAYVEFFPLFALLMLFAMQGLRKKLWKASLYSVIVLLILICQVQTYQYRYYFIHWSEMNKERYWNVFMRIDQIVESKNPNADLLH